MANNVGDLVRELFEIGKKFAMSPEGIGTEGNVVYSEKIGGVGTVISYVTLPSNELLEIDRGAYNLLVIYNKTEGKYTQLSHYRKAALLGLRDSLRVPEIPPIRPKKR